MSFGVRCSADGRSIFGVTFASTRPSTTTCATTTSPLVSRRATPFTIGAVAAFPSETVPVTVLRVVAFGIAAEKRKATGACGGNNGSPTNTIDGTGGGFDVNNAPEKA